MRDEIKVHVVDYGRKSLYMRYRDPVTGKQIARSSGAANEKAAAKKAANWEAELQEGRYKAPSKVTWAEFRQRYEDEKLTELADKTACKVASVFNAIEELVNPSRLADLDGDKINRFKSLLREKRGIAETTITGHLAHLQAALNWAVSVGMLPVAPKIAMPKRAKKSKVMKGRPIATEEFERMIAKVPDIVTEPLADSWRHYLRGLWWSGLRLEESLELWWDRDDRLCVDMTGDHVMLRIPAELEKGHCDRLLPIAPEFEEFLLATPKDERAGPVFTPKPQRVKGPRLTAHRVGEIVSEIGNAANVKVHTDPRNGKFKYAGAHDLRRSFGNRWADRVMPVVLQELMRHEEIETTLRYYVGRQAKSTARVLWEALPAFSETSGNRAAEPSSANEQAPPQTDSATGLVK